MTRKGVVCFCLIAVLISPSFAWVFPEHKDISVLAVQRLDPERRALLQKLWIEARSVAVGHLCEDVVDPAGEVNPSCIDYADWTAIAGDHSC